MYAVETSSAVSKRFKARDVPLLLTFNLFVGLNVLLRKATALEVSKLRIRLFPKSHDDGRRLVSCQQKTCNNSNIGSGSHLFGIVDDVAHYLSYVVHVRCLIGCKRVYPGILDLDPESAGRQCWRAGCDDRRRTRNR